MNWLMQNPLVIIIAGVVAEIVLFLVLQQTGEKWVAWTMAGVALLIVGAVALERWVVTPGEAIRAKLYEIAADAQRNDVDAVLANISRRAIEQQDEARRRFGQFTLKEVSIKQISELKVTDPPERGSVRVRVKGVVSVGTTGIRAPGLQEFNVQFVVEDDEWKVRGWDPLGNPLLPQ